MKKCYRCKEKTNNDLYLIKYRNKVRLCQECIDVWEKISSRIIFETHRYQVEDRLNKSYNLFLKGYTFSYNDGMTKKTMEIIFGTGNDPKSNRPNEAIIGVGYGFCNICARINYGIYFDTSGSEYDYAHVCIDCMKKLGLSVGSV